MHFGLIALSVVMVAALWWMYRHTHRKIWRERSNLMDACVSLLETPRMSQNAAGYAELRGICRGFQVCMTLEEDHAVMRKIPSLWLHIVVQCKSALVSGSLDMLVRPQNTEFYSPAWDWDGIVAPLPGWPEHAIYRTRNTPPDLQAIDISVRSLFADEKMKELLLLPRSIRLTYQIKQAARGEYLLLRAAIFDGDPLQRQRVQDLLEQLVDVRQNLEALSA